VTRFPRIRRPRLRQRPINESSPRVAPAKPEMPARPEPPAHPEPEPPTQELKPEPAGPDPAADSGRKRRVPTDVIAAVALVLVLGVALAILIKTGVVKTGENQPAAPAPQISGGQPKQKQQTPPPKPESQPPADLGFPAFATQNTTRVGGADPTADAAGVALAAFPSQGGSEPPQAVVLVGDQNWQGGIAAASLTAQPLHAPILLSTKDEVPADTSAALTALGPQGSVASGGAQAILVGDVAAPDGLQVRRVGGKDPASQANAIDLLRRKLGISQPHAVVVVSDSAAAFSMPAAAWAARSGDVVLFTGPKKLPKPTIQALGRHKNLPVYVLGPSSVIPSAVFRQIDQAGGRVSRVSGEDPVSNAIALATYSSGGFGWDINDPGHGFVVARSDRPLDAAAAAALSAGGTWGPLLITDSADTLPGALRGYFLNVKPGYATDPTRALYNHVWVIGDKSAIDVAEQAEIDDLAALARIGGNPQPKPPKPKKQTQKTQKKKGGK
jgi:hypothetical protein